MNTVEDPRQTAASLQREGDGFQLFVRLDPAMHEALYDRAVSEGRTLASVTREALRAWLGQGWAS